MNGIGGKDSGSNKAANDLDLYPLDKAHHNNDLTTTPPRHPAVTGDAVTKSPPRHDPPTTDDVTAPPTVKRKVSFARRHAGIMTLLLTSVFEGLQWSVDLQYPYRYFRDQYEDELDRLNVTGSNGTGECGVALAPAVQAVESQISSETTRWNLYWGWVSIGPILLSSVVLGLWSDRIGRRFLFLVPCAAGFLYGVNLAVVVWFHLHPGYLLIGAVLYCSGGSGLALQYAAQAVVSDTHGIQTDEDTTATDTTTPQRHPAANTDTKDDINNAKDNKDTKPIPTTTTTTAGSINGRGDPETSDDDNQMDMSREKTRALKLVLLDVGPLFLNSLSSFGAGYVLQSIGFFYSVVIALVLKAALLVFAFVFITETGQQRNSSGLMAPIRTILKAAKDPRKRVTLLLVNLAFMFSSLGRNDQQVLLSTYQMSPPFCFDSLMLGWYRGAASIRNILALPVMGLWRRLRMSESTVGMVGMACQAAAVFFVSSVRQTWVFFAMAAISIPGALTKSMARTLTSRLVGRSALASTFALMAILDEVLWFVSTNAGTFLYQSYVSTLPTAPFYLAAAAFTASSLLYGAQTCYQRRHPLHWLEGDSNTVTVAAP